MPRIEKPPALQEAIRIAPVDPMGDGKVIQYARNRIEQYKQTLPTFKKLYEETLEEVNFAQKDVDAITLYLSATAFTLAAQSFSINSGLTEKETLQPEADASYELFRNLTDKRVKTEVEALENTERKLYPSHTIGSNTSNLDLGANIPENAFQRVQENKEKLPKLKEKLAEIVKDMKAKMTSGFRPGIRDIQDCYKKALAYCQEIGYEDPPIWNLTLGNINWVIPQDQLEPELRDVPNKLGLSGAKLTRIQRREIEYEMLMQRAGVNYFGYQDPPVGWKALIDRNETYLQSLGLDGYQPYSETGNAGTFERYLPEGSFISYGGADGTRRAMLVTRNTIREEDNDPLYQPKVLFPTPGFTMIADQAKNLGMGAVELVTKPEGNFFPSGEEIIEKLRKDKDIRIVVLTPINNPGSKIADPEAISDIYRALEQYEEETGIKITVINDLAYFGSGDEQANKVLAHTLRTYKRRWDIIPLSTKILQEPGLRCSGSFTPDENLAKNVLKTLRSDALVESFAMQKRALATLDFVSKDDLRAGMDAYIFRQKQMLEVISARPDVFEVANAIMRSDDLAALYVFSQLSEGIDPVDLMLSGLFFSPDDSFLFKDSKLGKRFARASIGMIPMTERTVSRMKDALENTNFK